MNNSGLKGTAVTLHPGAVRTGLQNNFLVVWWKKAITALFYPFILFTFKTATQGAQTNLYCLLEDDDKLVKGGYYADCKSAKTLSPQVLSLEAGATLWQLSEKAYGIKFEV